jgi:DinB family protein
MAFTFAFDHLLTYTDWERAQWHAWFREQGPATLALASLPAGDIDALFAFGGQSRGALRELLASFPTDRWDVPQQIQIGPHTRSVTPRKMVVQALMHEIRHWAQATTLLRLRGFKPGSRDFLVSPVLEEPRHE